MSKKVHNYLLFGGINRDDYLEIRPLLWKRNVRSILITSILAMVMGTGFLIIQLINQSDNYFPYIFLGIGSLFIFILLILIKKKNEVISMLLCYGEMLLIVAYAGILSIQASNVDVPATSIIVFIALLPLAVDDRPLRMFVIMISESVGYLILSKLLKTPHALKLDLMNVVTFCVVGMVIYSIICSRNIREIHQSARIEKIQQGIIVSLANVVEERDESTGNHIRRTSNYVEMIVEQMKKSPLFANLNEDYYKNVILAAPMHDIGKIKISDQILNKPGKLTPEEYSIMKKHSKYGGDIIHQTINEVEEKEYCDIAYNVACYHHEKWDGSGYPCGLKGEEIPLEARIMAIADVYDALVSERCYKKAMPKEAAIAIIEQGMGTQFDPILARMFIDSISKLDE